MNPTVSIIVPLFNVEHYVEACFESLKAQTFTDWEAVCIDDQSTDASFARAQAAAAGDARFVFLQNDVNKGLSATRNAGLAAARGTFVMFLDSDDALAPEALAVLVDAAQANDLDLVDFTADLVYEEPEDHSEDYFMHRTSIEGVHSGPDLFCAYLKLRQYCCPACFHFISRDLLAGIPLAFEEGILHEDELFSPLLHAHAKRAQFVNRGLYLRRMRAGSIMTSARGIRNVAGVFKVTRELYAWLVDHAADYSDAFVDAFAQRIHELHLIMAEDILRCSDDDLVAFEQGLTPQERADFSLHGLQLAEDVQEKQELLSSKTWKLADGFARGARLARRIALK